MQIKKLENKDIDKVVDLWYETSVTAHDFISPEYWKDNKTAMAEKYLPGSETYLALVKNEIAGFVTMVDNYLAAIFISPEMQGKGLGKQLLDFVKIEREIIQLKVYKKNSKTLQFYKNQNFELVSENEEEATGEMECLMQWEK